MAAGSMAADVSTREPQLHSGYPCSCAPVPPTDHPGAKFAKEQCRNLARSAHSYFCQRLHLPFGYLPAPRVLFPRRPDPKSAAQYDLNTVTLKFQPGLLSGIEGVEAVGEEVAHHVHSKLRGKLFSERRTAAIDTGLQVIRFIVLSNYMEAVGHYAGLAFAQHLYGERALGRSKLERRAQAQDLVAEGTDAMRTILRNPDTPGVVGYTLHPFGYALALSAYFYYGDEKLPQYFNMSIDRFVAECKFFRILEGDPWDILLEKLDLLGSWNARLK